MCKLLLKIYNFFENIDNSKQFFPELLFLEFIIFKNHNNK